MGTLEVVRLTKLILTVFCVFWLYVKLEDYDKRLKKLESD